MRNFVLISRFLLVPAVLADNWAGGILKKDDGAFNYVKGTVTAPKLSGTPGSALAQWVVIDADRLGCEGASLTSGIVSIQTPTGEQHQGYLHWLPYPSVNLDIAISTGDKINVELDLSDQSTGSLKFENLMSGQNVTKKFQSTIPLCGSGAGWLVGLARTEETSFNMSSFDTVSITDAAAGVRGGSSYHPLGSSLYEVDGRITRTTAYENDSLSVAFNPLG